MTLTDEDRALFVALVGYDSETIDAILGGDAFTREVEQIAHYRQAAFNAGLERAAVIAEDYQQKWGDAAGFESQSVAARVIYAAIRAEKEKPQ